MTVEPVAQPVPLEYELTHDGTKVRIIRRDVEGTPSLIVECVDGVYAIGAADPAYHRDGGSNTFGIGAYFPIGDDLDDALLRASTYARTVAVLVKQHRVKLEAITENAKATLELARTASRAGGPYGFDGYGRRGVFT